MLYLVATPIGNLEDMSPRAVEALRSAQVIACEDTRRTRILLDRFEIKPYPKLVSYRDGIEARVAERLVELLVRGETVACCSDGGYPGISDPGYRLVRAAIEAGAEFSVIPGASAVPVALLLSGLSAASYVFKGFPPRKHGQRRRFFEADGGSPHTMVVFESPMRVAGTLEDALAALGDREAAVCIELTKKFERVHRGYLSDLCRLLEDRKLKGEVTIVIAGNNSKFIKPPDAEAAGV